MKQPLKECYSCPFVTWVCEENGTEPKAQCDPPMGECSADRPVEFAIKEQ